MLLRCRPDASPELIPVSTSSATSSPAADSKHHMMEPSLPYELLALEAALSAHTRALEAETAELESQAKPSLEHLLQSVRPCLALLWMSLPLRC